MPPAGGGTQGSASGAIAPAGTAPAGTAVDLPNSSSQAAAFALVTGQVTNQGPGSPALGLAGQGTLNAATTIQLSSLLPTGALQVLGNAAVNAGGSFSVKAPLNVGLVIAQALNASGQVVGSVVVGATGSVAGSTIVSAPITTQTSLQSQVLTTAAVLQQEQRHGAGPRRREQQPELRWPCRWRCRGTSWPSTSRPSSTPR